MSRSYEQIAERYWNLPSKGEEEAAREQYFMDDVTLKAHLQREIERNLDGASTVLDAGAGAGRFSIPLAVRGFQVTHLDISQPMIDQAKSTAAAAGVAEEMTFVQSRLTDLSRYQDRQFDLVICTDTPVSYCYPDHREVLKELVRVARKAVVVSVSSRLGYLPYLFNPVQKLQYLADPSANDKAVQYYVQTAAEKQAAWEPDFVYTEAFWESGLTQDPDALYNLFEQGKAPWPPNYCFMPEELHAHLSEAGLQEIRLAGPGAFARSVPQPILQRVLSSEEHRKAFLDLCYRFDSQPTVCGLGKDNLVGSGRKA